MERRPDTTMVKDIRGGQKGSNPNPQVVVGSNLYMVATDAASGEQVWQHRRHVRRNGAGIGHRPGPERLGSPALVVTMGGKLYFSAFNRRPRRRALAEQRQHRIRSAAEGHLARRRTTPSLSA